MHMKWIGIILIIAGCGSCGFYVAATEKSEIRMLKQLIRAISFMESELRYNLKKLPEICNETAKISGGVIRDIFRSLAKSLEFQMEPDAASCMINAIENTRGIPRRIRFYLIQLGRTLGRFDLIGQLSELEHLAESCNNELKLLTHEQGTRLRGYQTLALCTGVAVAILLL